MWHGTFEEYCRLYDIASKHLKAAFPHLKIGGYGSCGVGAAAERDDWHPGPRLRHQSECFHAFLRYVAEHGCPIDFFSYHSYAGVPDLPLQIAYVREHLDKAGFAHVPTCLNEWLPAPNHDKLGTAQQAAEVAATLLLFQNGPVDSAAIYDARCGVGNYSPLFNPLTYRPHKAYYAFLAFHELRRRGTAVRVEGCGAENLFAAAARGEDGSVAVMLANLGDREIPFSLEVAGDGKRMSADRCRIVDDARTWEDAPLPASLPPHSFLLAEGGSGARG